MEDIYYVKDKKFVLVDNCNRFIYEVFVFVQHKNIFSMANHKYFSVDQEIPKVVECFHVNEYVTIECEMYSAPLKWLKANDFIPYVAPEKKKRIIKKNNDEKSSEVLLN